MTIILQVQWHVPKFESLPPNYSEKKYVQHVLDTEYALLLWSPSSQRRPKNGQRLYLNYGDWATGIGLQPWNYPRWKREGKGETQLDSSFTTVLTVLIANISSYLAEYDQSMDTRKKYEVRKNIKKYHSNKVKDTWNPSEETVIAGKCKISKSVRLKRFKRWGPLNVASLPLSHK